MLKNSFTTSMFFLVFLYFGNLFVQAQVDTPKIEIGGHFTFINIEPPTFGGFAQNRTSDPGLGTRITYNLTRVFSLEAEVNYFPSVQNDNPILGPSNGGRKVQGLFGTKIGTRRDKFGIFGKVRPGVIHFSDVFNCWARDPQTQGAAHIPGQNLL